MGRVLLILAWFAGASIGNSAQAAPADGLYREQYRPQFHFSPPQQWMNDPNGMLYDHG